MKKIIKIIRLFFSVVIVSPSLLLALLGLVFYYLFSLIRLRSLGEKISYFFYTILCWWILIGFGAIVHIEGRENIPREGESVIYAPNHNSLMDVPFFYSALRRFPSMMAKKELFKIPLLHGLLISLKCVKIDRKSGRGIIEAVKKGCERVESGHSLVVFPEGTRSKTGEIGTFKNGAFKIAERTKCAIVPVAIKNDRLIAENAHFFGFVPIYIKFLTKIETKNLSEEDEKNLGPYVEKIVKEEWAKLPLCNR